MVPRSHSCLCAHSQLYLALELCCVTIHCAFSDFHLGASNFAHGQSMVDIRSSNILRDLESLRLLAKVLPLSSAIEGMVLLFCVHLPVVSWRCVASPFSAIPHPWSPGVLHQLLPHFSPRWQQHRIHVFRSHSIRCCSSALGGVASPFCSRPGRFQVCCISMSL